MIITSKRYLKIYFYRSLSLDKHKCKINPFKLLIKTIKALDYLTSFEFMIFILMNFDDENINEIKKKKLNIEKF